jgi:hypothetical protein
MSTGAHYNPLNMTHGGPDNEIRHNGDLGNLRTDKETPIIETKFVDRMITLYGNFSIVGRGCVFHEKEDDLGRGPGQSKINGNAGARIACGVVEVTESSAIVIFCFVFLFVAVFGLFFYIYYKSNDFKESRENNMAAGDDLKQT